MASSNRVSREDISFDKRQNKIDTSTTEKLKHDTAISELDDTNDSTNDVIYQVNENPPFILCLFLGFQVS